MFLGYDRGSNEYVLATQKRIVKARAIQRMVEGKRWNAEALQEVTLSPYSLYVRPDPEVYFRKDPAVVTEETQKKPRSHHRTTRSQPKQTYT